ncbi:MAG: hypothetical protein ACM3PW_00260 [Chlamydiota bacterium]
MRKQRSGTQDSSSPRSRKKRLAAAASVLPLAIGLASTQLPSGRAVSAPSFGKFVAACTLPFDAIKQQHPIDESCDLDGVAKPDTPQARQNEAKNNFCAAGPPVDINFDVLHQLQTLAARRVSFGSDSALPHDRSALRDLPTSAGTIGEGTLVRMAAYVMEARYSNRGKGESVNCKRPDNASNDIHVVLVERAPVPEKPTPADECDSATAEISPHFRPDVWTPDMLLAKDKLLFSNAGNYLFRFTGQLFFDASHVPCRNGTGPSPRRFTIWEIHPVYNMEVCTAPDGKCDAGSNANWESLVDFAAQGSTETRLRLPEDIFPGEWSGVKRTP